MHLKVSNMMQIRKEKVAKYSIIWHIMLYIISIECDYFKNHTFTPGKVGTRYFIVNYLKSNLYTDN